MKDILILLLAIVLSAYLVWNGITLSFKSGKIDLSIEIYALSRFFSKVK